jgi:hypothetical protein
MGSGDAGLAALPQYDLTKIRSLNVAWGFGGRMKDRAYEDFGSG